MLSIFLNQRRPVARTLCCSRASLPAAIARLIPLFAATMGIKGLAKLLSDEAPEVSCTTCDALRERAQRMEWCLSCPEACCHFVRPETKTHNTCRKPSNAFMLLAPKI